MNKRQGINLINARKLFILQQRQHAIATHNEMVKQRRLVEISLQQTQIIKANIEKERKNLAETNKLIEDFSINYASNDNSNLNKISLLEQMKHIEEKIETEKFENLLQSLLV
jgi:hypothetical protein